MKILIIGASTTGKTTIVKHLQQFVTNIPIQEADQVVTAMNGGVYPHDSKLKMETLSPKMVKNVLEQDNIIFLSNTHYFTLIDLKKAHELGFKIILLKISRPIMVNRNAERVVNEGYDNLTQYFDGMLSYQDEIIKSKLADHTINVDQPIEKTTKILRRIIYE